MCLNIWKEKQNKEKEGRLFEKETDICMLRSCVDDGPYNNRRIPNKSK